jgi:hypothetical protein
MTLLKSIIFEQLALYNEKQELSKETTCAVEFYNLNAIISVGYRVNSTLATHFRILTATLLSCLKRD